MNRLSVMLVCFIAVSISVTHPAWSQCCAGAQHRSSDSFDGRFRVKGESLTPLGHHGPYHFKFRFLERANSGDYRELESFEMKWNVTDHFNMELMVSPLGNGFAVDFPDGWGLVRPSNTRPVLTLRFEADTAAGLVRITNLFQRELRYIDPTLIIDL